METKIAGWYVQTRQSDADPALLRYWDGYRWTEHTMPVPDDSSPQAVAAAYGSVYGTPALPGAAGPATTPDGQLLAGWWQRVGATLIDSVVVGVLLVVAAFPLWAHVFGVYADYLHETVNASRVGAPAPSSLDVQRRLLGSLALIGLIGLAISLAYSVGFLAWRQATPGKLAVGLRVRRRETPGPMPMRTILLHWVAQYGPNVLGIVPLVGGLASLYALLDSLWPLWDDKNQTLHDKVAGTNVVRHRP